MDNLSFPIQCSIMYLLVDANFYLLLKIKWISDFHITRSNTLQKKHKRRQDNRGSCFRGFHLDSFTPLIVGP